jgi:hypothetical protein
MSLYPTRHSSEWDLIIIDSTIALRKIERCSDLHACAALPHPRETCPNKRTRVSNRRDPYLYSTIPTVYARNDSF